MRPPQHSENTPYDGYQLVTALDYQSRGNNLSPGCMLRLTQDRSVCFLDPYPVDQRVGNALHQINHYQADMYMCGQTNLSYTLHSYLLVNSTPLNN